MSKMWTLRLDGVPGFVNSLAATIKGRVYAFSTFEMCYSYIDDDSEYPIEVYTFDAASYRWDMLKLQSPGDDVPICTTGRSVVAYGHCAYMWGGSHTNTVLNGLYCFDTLAMRWSRPEACGEVPTDSLDCTACVLGQRMYIFNGPDGDSLQHIRFLDLEDLKWHRVRTSGEAPARRWADTATAIGTRMYVWGGNLIGEWPGDLYDSFLYYLETTTATWVRPRVVGVTPQARQGHSAFVYDGELYIFGGYRGGLDIYFKDMHKYNPIKSCWSEVTPHGSGPVARRSAGCSVLGERVFLFGGIDPLDNDTDGERIEDFREDERELHDLHVLHLAPTLKNLCLLAVIDAGLDVWGLVASIRDEINAITSCSS